MELNPELKKLFETFKTPMDIQIFLNNAKYNPADDCKGPLGVAKDRLCHCYDGAFFAAAALRFMGFKPLLVRQVADNDDDHLLAIFEIDGHFGAVAKSNTTTLRYREPVYQTIRELMMSYFDLYFSITYKKSLRAYSDTINLEEFDEYDWMNSTDMHDLLEKIFDVKYHKLITKEMIGRLERVDEELYKACFMNSDWEGLYKPKEEGEE